MSKITISLEAKFLIPTLNVYTEYFNGKYPCTDENNDGSNMSLEDEVKYATYNYLLNVYENSKEIFLSEYETLKKRLRQSKCSSLAANAPIIAAVAV